MKSENEILYLIIEFAKMDSNILAVSMNGSRVNKQCICDEYSDFDIQYIVKDISPYIQNKKWMNYFGKVLIVQEPEDWFSHQYNIESKNQYPFLMQFSDGNRIDLVFVHVDRIDQFNKELEPRKVLLNKNNELFIKEIAETNSFEINKPFEKEFLNIVNEFLWLSLYVLKGIKRNEIPYAKTFFDNYEIELLCKMLSWKIGISKGFDISLGKSYKYLSKYLTENEMNEFIFAYSSGIASDIFKKLLYMIDLFKETAIFVADKLDYKLDITQIDNISNYIRDKDLTTAST